jgi:glycosyltransferase involved in cell wall biosynthesis
MFILDLKMSECSFELGDLDLGGIQTANAELASALCRMGHDIFIRIPVAEGHVFRLTAKNYNMTLTRTPTERKPDFIITNNNPSNFAFFENSDARKVLWLHNTFSIEKCIRKRQLFPIFRYRPTAVFVSHYQKNHMCRYPFRNDVVIGHGISAPFLQNDLNPKNNSVSRFIWASQPYRGLDQVLDVLRQRIAPALKDAEFHVFGSASQASRDRVFFHGRLTKKELAVAYQGATAMICPGDKSETFCLAAAEAQCAGVPVITLGIGALGERVRHGVDGFICSNMENMAETAILLARNSTLRETMSLAAWENRYARSWDDVARLWKAWIFDWNNNQSKPAFAG